MTMSMCTLPSATLITVLAACEVSNCIRQQVHVAAWCFVKEMPSSVAAVLDRGTCSCSDVQSRPLPVW